MPDYSKAVIYVIQHKLLLDLVYVGSTCLFKSRKSHHKRNCNDPLCKEYNFKLYQMIRENGGWNDFVCEIIEQYPCDNKEQLTMREKQMMKEHKATMNTIDAYQSPEERLAYQKQQNINNKDKKRQYDIDNADKIKEQSKQYYINNKDKLKEQIAKKTTCVCGSVYRACDKTRHEKSIKHQKYLVNV